jgi:molybdopterin-guanine dinucleotide biosynthesis protein A
VSALVGIFVGGKSTRMGSAKGLLAAPGGTKGLVQRLVDEAHAALPDAECVLVGQRPEYDHLDLVALPDARADCGPLGGLVALLLEARRRDHDAAYALACDMPYLSRVSIAQLASFAPDADVVAPRRDERWEPLAARYAPKACLPLATERLHGGQLSLQRLLDALGPSCREIALPAPELDDWDSPEDLATR